MLSKRGRKSGFKTSEEVKKKISDTLKKKGIRPPLLKGKKAPGYIHGNCCRKKYNKCIECGKNISQYARRWCKNCFKTIYREENHHNYNIKLSKKTRRKISLSMGGNGIIDMPYNYSTKFKKLKLIIRKRDNYICQLCSITEEEHIVVYGKVLCVHHIDYDKENCDKNNLITLCNGCNIRVNFNRKYWKQYFQMIHVSEQCCLSCPTGKSRKYVLNGLKIKIASCNENKFQGGKKIWQL